MEPQQTRIFNPDTYRNQYYKTPEGHSEQNSQFSVNTWMEETSNMLPECEYGLQIGCGPILLMATYFSKKIKHLILSEYNTDCFVGIKKFIQGNSQESLFWETHWKIIAKKEEITCQELALRLRKMIVACINLDLNKQNIFDLPYLKQMDVITSSLCVEAVAKSDDEYKSMIKKIKSYLKIGGYLFLIGVLEQTFYMVGDQRLPCLSLNEALIKQSMNESGLKIIKFNVYRPENPPKQTSDFKGLFSILVQNQKKI